MLCGKKRIPQPLHRLAIKNDAVMIEQQDFDHVVISFNNASKSTLELKNKKQTITKGSLVIQISNGNLTTYFPGPTSQNKIEGTINGDKIHFDIGQYEYEDGVTFCYSISLLSPQNKTTTKNLFFNFEQN